MKALLTAVIFLMLSIQISATSATSANSSVELQNRTVNLSSNFNIYIYINSSEPFGGFGTDFNYDNDSLQVNYQKWGNLFQYVPAGRYVWFEGYWYGRECAPNSACYGSIANSWVALLSPYNKTGKITYMTINMRGKKKGTSVINLTRMSLISADWNGTELLNSSRSKNYTVKVT